MNKSVEKALAITETFTLLVFSYTLEWKEGNLLIGYQNYCMFSLLKYEKIDFDRTCGFLASDTVQRKDNSR